MSKMVIFDVPNKYSIIYRLFLLKENTPSEGELVDRYTKFVASDFYNEDALVDMFTKEPEDVMFKLITNCCRTPFKLEMEELFKIYNRMPSCVDRYLYADPRVIPAKTITMSPTENNTCIVLDGVVLLFEDDSFCALIRYLNKDYPPKLIIQSEPASAELKNIIDHLV